MTKLDTDVEIEQIINRVSEIFDKVNNTVCGDKSQGCQNCCVTCVSPGYFDFWSIESDARYPYEAKINHIVRWKKLPLIPEAKEQFDKLKREYNWHYQKGFLGDKGCNLPRSKRPIYCLRSLCHILKEKISREDQDELETLLHRLYDIRKETKVLI